MPSGSPGVSATGGQRVYSELGEKLGRVRTRIQAPAHERLQRLHTPLPHGEPHRAYAPPLRFPRDPELLRHFHVHHLRDQLKALRLLHAEPYGIRRLEVPRIVERHSKAVQKTLHFQAHLFHDLHLLSRCQCLRLRSVQHFQNFHRFQRINKKHGQRNSPKIRNTL